MEKPCLALREFVLADVNGALPLYEGGGVAMPRIEEASCRLGVIDPLKVAGDTLCAILPVEYAPDRGYISGAARGSLNCTVAFWCRNAPYEELLARMSRYASCFASCLEGDCSLDGALLSAKIAKIGYDCDCGTAERQAAACEIELQITYEESLDGVFNQEAQDDSLYQQGDAGEPGLGSD